MAYNVSGLIWSIPCQSKAEYILTMMNEELLAASAVLVQGGVRFANCYAACVWPAVRNCPILRQPKSAVHKQVAKLFQQHWRHLKGNYELNFAFEMPTVY